MGVWEENRRGEVLFWESSNTIYFLWGVLHQPNVWECGSLFESRGVLHTKEVSEVTSGRVMGLNGHLNPVCRIFILRAISIKHWKRD